MNENFNKTSQPQIINRKLEKAIDEMDMIEIDSQLTKLSKSKPFPYEIEDSKIFAKRIIKQNERGYGSMRKKTKKFGAVVACFALTIAVGVTGVYATGILKNFKFYNEKTTVEVRTNKNMSEEEAASIAKQAQEDFNSSSTEGNRVTPEEKIFSSIEEVEKAVGVEIILPSDIPADFEMEKEINVYDSRNDNHNIYITYKSKEKENRLLGISIITKNQPEDTTVVSVTDAVHECEYQTPTGRKYSIMKEDEGILAMTDIDNIKYILVFKGVNEEEMHQIINSAI